ncbi:MAG: hypothetical protein COB98_01960 [Flavobacteriaceae bacterium]|nr:MAG: hypothetical protein COB98_01960 [Flavobacteriaceae bacterium]
MKNQFSSCKSLTFVRANQQLTTVFEKIKSNAFAHAILKGGYSMVTLLNEKNELVFASDLFLKNFYFRSPEDIIGRALGETLNCIYYDANTGCEGRKICASCGVPSLLNNSIPEGNVSTSIIAYSGDLITEKHYELSYIGIALDGDKFKMLTLTDVSAIKRKERLESVYLKRMTVKLAIAKEQFGKLKKFSNLDNSLTTHLHDLLEDTIVQLNEGASF